MTGTGVFVCRDRGGSPQRPEERRFHLHPRSPRFPAPDGKVQPAHGQNRNPKASSFRIWTFSWVCQTFYCKCSKRENSNKASGVNLPPLAFYIKMTRERISFWGWHNPFCFPPPAQKILPSKWRPLPDCQRHGTSWALRRRWGQCPWDQNSNHVSRKNTWVSP